METILQKYPDCKVVCSIGGGGNIGANEALMTATGGTIPEDMGVFATDGTKEQMESLLGDEATRGVIGFEGSYIDVANTVASLYARTLNNEFDESNKIIYRNTNRITTENAQKILEGMQ
ncbi:MAG TPA: hypothetical protein DF613_03500 [Lachnospiraceae bacterium]|nr:hypothetical protein [Lachnospiraceae bacterium]